VTDAELLAPAGTTSRRPPDPVGEAVAESIAGIVHGAVVELVYWPAEDPAPPTPITAAGATAVGEGPPGWRLRCTVRLEPPLAVPAIPDRPRLQEILGVLARAAIGTATRFRAEVGGVAPRALSPSLRRGLRDTLVVEVLARYQTLRGGTATTALIADTIEYLIELSGARLESRELTHGVVITDVFADVPRLRFDYPADLRAAKRAPLLFDGQRSVLIVDSRGHLRTELPRQHLGRLPGRATRGSRLTDCARRGVPGHLESGSLVAAVTARMGGLGFFLGADRTIWAFLDGEPLLLRRREHWTAFPLELTAFIAGLIGGGRAAGMVVQAAYMLSARGHGAILAVVDDRHALDGIVPTKDRYDLRHRVDRRPMRPETRLHHLIDAEDLDEETLSRLAGLDGATIVDRDARLVAYGAIVASFDCQSEGARTAAAATLSQTADAVLMVSQDGDITVFHGGVAVAALLGPRAHH
jgi:hypothetical protein